MNNEMVTALFLLCLAFVGFGCLKLFLAYLQNKPFDPTTEQIKALTEQVKSCYIPIGFKTGVKYEQPSGSGIPSFIIEVIPKEQHFTWEPNHECEDVSQTNEK